MSDDRIERYSQLLAKAERERDEACAELVAERGLRHVAQRLDDCRAGEARSSSSDSTPLTDQTCASRFSSVKALTNPLRSRLGVSRPGPAVLGRVVLCEAYVAMQGEVLLARQERGEARDLWHGWRTNSASWRSRAEKAEAKAAAVLALCADWKREYNTPTRETDATMLAVIYQIRDALGAEQ